MVRRRGSSGSRSGGRVQRVGRNDMVMANKQMNNANRVLKFYGEFDPLQI